MKPPVLVKFRGLNNVSDPMRLPLGWLTRADNVHISDTGALSWRDGYSRTMAGSFTGAYATLDHSRMYVVDAGILKAMAGGAASGATLMSGLAAARVHWTEINEQVFFNNGVDAGIIQPDNEVLDWRWPTPGTPTLTAVTGSLPAGWYQVCCTFRLADGRMTGSGVAAEILLGEGEALQITDVPQLAGADTCVWIAPANSEVFQLADESAASTVSWNASPDALGRELGTPLLEQLPLGCEVIQAWKGRIYAAQYMPEADQTVIWVSQPLGFHLFDLAKGNLIVPGHVLMMAPTPEALVIGTERRISAFDGTGMAQLAPYGVVPGQHWAHEDEEGDRILFWSTRGLCAGLPFANLTEAAVSVAPGLNAGGAVVRKDGQRRYVVALQQGGSAFNQRN